jgi:exonuclease VII small subunit
MRKRWQVALLAWLLCGVSVAKTETAPELKARADGAHGAEQVKLCLEYAQVELEQANALFTAGDVEQAQSAVGAVMEYLRKGVDAAKSSGKRLKQTEIELRKLEKRMKDIAESLNIDDRPAVLKSVDEIEQLRAGLLSAMFGPQSEPKAKS